MYYVTPTLSIYKFSLSVCLYPINVKTSKPIRPKFCMGPHVTPGKIYELSKLKEKDKEKKRNPEACKWNPRSNFFSSS